MRKPIYILTIAVMILLAIASCRPTGTIILSAGNTIQNDFTFYEPATELNVHNNIEVFLDPSIPAGTVRVKADANAMKQMNVVNDNGALTICFDKRHSFSEEVVKVYLSENDFNTFNTTGIASIHSSTPLERTKVHLNAIGKSTISFDRIQAKTVEIEVVGNSEIIVSGDTGQVKAEATGASLIKTGELISEEAQINSTGTSRIEVHVTRSLTGKCIGTSEIIYAGEPQTIDVKTMGTATVKAR